MVCLMMCLSVLTGCNLWSRNNANYYNAVVATITYSDNTKDEIKKEELLVAYSSYGYNYVQNYGYTTQKAIETTLDTIIDNYLVRRAVKDYREEQREEYLNDRETSYLWDKTYDAIYSNLLGYVEGYKKNDDSSNTSDSSSSAIFKDYTSTVYLDEVGGKLVIRKKTPATTTRETYEVKQNERGEVYDFEKNEFKDLMYDRIQNILTLGNEDNQRVWKNAYSKYISVIKDNYEYLDKKTNKDWFMFELERVYKILKDNYIVETYETIFNTRKHQDADISSVSVLDVLKSYENKVNEDYTSYKLKNGSDYAEKMLTDISNMDYILEGNGTSNYFYVAPIKVNLTTEDTALLSSYKDLYDKKYISEDRYNQLKAEIFDTSRELVSVRNATTGEEEGKISVNNLKARIDADVSRFHYDFENEDEDYNYNVSLLKAEAYRKYFYLYNDETTYKNADYNAVFGVDSTGTQALVGSAYDNENIKEAILELYNGGNVNVGDLSDIVETDGGFYIFFYAGKVENLFAVSGQGLSLTNEQSIRTLASKRLNIFSSKTLFDSVYSGLESDNFSVFKGMDVNRLRSETKSLERFENNLKDLY